MYSRECRIRSILTWEVPEHGEDDVDQQVGAAAGDEEDAEGRDCVEARLAQG